MKRLLAVMLGLTLWACAPSRTTVSMSWGPNWYSYCTWDTPCWYSDHVIFVYGWGYIEKPIYVYLVEHPSQREGWAYRRREWHPSNKPAYRGRDWNGYKEETHEARRHERHEEHREHEHDH